MKKLKTTFLFMSLLVFGSIAYMRIRQVRIGSAELWGTILPKTYVTFNWVDQAKKQFWVNNSYIRLFMDGTEGIGFNDLRHKSNLAQDLLDDTKMKVVGPTYSAAGIPGGNLMSRWADRVPLANINVSYTQVTPSFLKLNVTAITVGNFLKYTFLLYIGDSEVIMVNYRVTFLKDANVTEIGHELVPTYMASMGSLVGYMNKTRHLNMWRLTGDGGTERFADTAARTFPLGENWVAVWNTTRNFCAGLIYVDQSMLLNPLGRTTIGVWDGAAAGVAALFGRWYEGSDKLVSAGSEFDDTVLLWFGTGDYSEIRNLAGMVEQILDPEFWSSLPPKTYVTFNWVDQAKKQFWVNNSYIRCFFDGTQGGLLVDLYHNSSPTNDLMDDDKMVVDGPQIGLTSSRSGIPIENVSVSYIQITPSFATLSVSSRINGLKFTYVYYFADSEAIIITYKVAFLKDTNVTRIGHQFVLHYVACMDSLVAYMNKTGYINLWKLTGGETETIFANSTAGTFPFAENWMAVWNVTRNLCAAQIFLNQSMLLNPLNKTTIGLWDGAGSEVASLFSRWYEGPSTLIPTGSMFNDSVLLWFGTGDYTQVRNLAGMTEEILRRPARPTPPQPTGSIAITDHDDPVAWGGDHKVWINYSYSDPNGRDTKVYVEFQCRDPPYPYFGETSFSIASGESATNREVMVSVYMKDDNNAYQKRQWRWNQTDPPRYQWQAWIEDPDNPGIPIGGWSGVVDKKWLNVVQYAPHITKFPCELTLNSTVNIEVEWTNLTYHESGYIIIVTLMWFNGTTWLDVGPGGAGIAGNISIGTEGTGIANVSVSIPATLSTPIGTSERYCWQAVVQHTPYLGYNVGMDDTHWDYGGALPSGLHPNEDAYRLLVFPKMKSLYNDTLYDESDGRIDIVEVKAADYAQYLYCYMSARDTCDPSLFSYSFFMDTDKNITTGFIVNDIGADYRFYYYHNGSLLAAQLQEWTGSAWSYVCDAYGGFSRNQTDGFGMGFKAHRTSLGNPRSINIVVKTGTSDTAPDTGHVTYDLGWSEFSVVTLYKLHLEVNQTYLEGANLVLMFYEYGDVYQANTTVWTGTTSTIVTLSKNVTHPLGLPVEKATLVVTDNLGNIIETAAEFVMSRSYLMGRLGELDYLWTVPGSDRSAIMKEYVAIDGQWPYAPA